MWWIVVGSSVLSLVEMEAVDFYMRESVAKEGEWTALQKRVNSGSEGEWTAL